MIPPKETLVKTIMMKNMYIRTVHKLHSVFNETYSVGLFIACFYWGLNIAK